MTATTNTPPDPVGTLPTREPLRPRTTSPSPKSFKAIRRKHSILQRADSSEESPSSHESIYEAFYFSGNTSEDSSSRIELANLARVISPTLPNSAVANDENLRIQTATPSNPIPIAFPDIQQIQFLYGHGTVLHAITEQLSYASINTLARRRSADNVTSSLILGHRDSFSLSKSPRRKTSFSLDDLALIKRSYHEACSTIEYEARRQSQVHEIYAQPKIPIQEPPNRTPTPPGMPSWTASQNRHSVPQIRPTARTSAKQSRFQRFFSLSNTTTMMGPGALPPPNQFSTMPVRGRMAPRFRPPRSTYTPLDQHPFTRAPIANVSSGSSHVRTLRNVLSPPVSIAPTGLPHSRAQKTKKNRLGLRVRFTPSATARDSEMLSVQAAMDATAISALHPLAPIPAATFAPATTSRLKQPCPHRNSKPVAIVSPLSDLTNTANLSINPISIPPSTEYHALPSASPSPEPRSIGLDPTPDPSPTKARHCPSFAASSRRESVEIDRREIDMGLFEPIPALGNSGSIGSYSSRTHIMSGGLRSLNVSPYSSPSPTPSGNLTLVPTLGRPPTTVFDENERRDSGATFSSRNSADDDIFKEKEKWCWKCGLKDAKDTINHWWETSTRGLCFICCGIDLDDEMVGQGHGAEVGMSRGYSSMGGGMGYRGGSGFGGPHSGGFRDALGARRGIIGETPCGML